MRKNLPVTQHTYEYPFDYTLISITDLKGRITYCNQEFIDVSGYTAAELMGQPHNVLRHPDMPEETFRDFWDTIQKGMLWSAIIKNRRRNGDAYWVRANATPMFNGDKIVGYLSVRIRPSDAEIAAAEALYATMREEAGRGRLVHVVRRGTIRRRDPWGRLRQALRLSHRQRAILLVLLAAFVPLLIAHVDIPLWARVAVTAAVASAVGYRLDALLMKPLKGVIKTSRQLASGDLSHFVAAADGGVARRLLLPISQLALSIRTVMRDVRADLDRLQSSTREIASSSQDLSTRTEAQAMSIEKTATAMEQIGGTVRQTSSLAAKGVSIVQAANTTAGRSQEAVHGMAQTMQEITESSRRIGDIIQMIEGVAFQTNILALNAAVEAARAGEQGRGFAVVASEVRALAMRTTGLSKEIHGLVTESQTRVAQGSERARQARERMDEVMHAVQEVSQVLQDIDHAAQEQAQGIHEIGDAVQTLESTTQQNAALVQELAAASRMMDEQAGQARHNIQVFRLSPQDRTHAETDAVQLRRQQKTAGGAVPELEYAE